MLTLGFNTQEWAAHNGVPVPHKEGRVNNSLLYKGGEEDTPTNILQACTPLEACMFGNTSSEVTGTCEESATEPWSGVQGHDEIVWAVEIHNQQLFSASADKTIRVWDIASKRCERVSALPGYG